MNELSSPRIKLKWSRKNTNSEPDKCIIYWDYENMAIPAKTDLCKVKSWLKDQIWKTLDSKIPIEVRVYISIHKLTTDLCKDFERNGITQIHVPSNKAESVDKRIICDIALSLYELECDKKSRAIGLISSDHDFSFLLNKIHVTRPITHSFLISLHPKHVIDDNLLHSVDTFIVLDIASLPVSTSNSNIAAPLTPRSAKISIKLTDLKCHNRSFFMKTSLKNGMVNIVNTIYGKLMNPIHPKKCLSLMLDNKELSHLTSTVEQAGIVDGSQIFWFWNSMKMNEELNQEQIDLYGPEPDTIAVWLQNVESKQRSKFMVRPTTKIKKIKARMKRMCDAMRNMKYVTLWLRNQQMTNKFCLQSYGVEEGDTIMFDEFHYPENDERGHSNAANVRMPMHSNSNQSNVVMKELDGLDWVDDLVEFSQATPPKISIILSDVNTKQTYTFEVDPTVKIGKFKTQMRRESDTIMSMKSIKLIHKGLTMMNKHPWNEYGVKDGDIILFDEYSKEELDDYDANEMTKKLFQASWPIDDVDDDIVSDIDMSGKEKEKEKEVSPFNESPPFLATYLM